MCSPFQAYYYYPYLQPLPPYLRPCPPLTVPLTIYDRYSKTNLVSNQSTLASLTDPNLKNAWGITLDNNNQIWVADNLTNKLTSYTLNGTVISPAVPVVRANLLPIPPTGVVYNPTTNFTFTIPPNITASPAILITCTRSGDLCAYNPIQSPDAIAVYTSPRIVSNYTGLTLTLTHIYAANFGNHNVDVFDTSFVQENPIFFPFLDNSGTLLPNYYPFNVAYIDGFIYVLYANQNVKTGNFVTGAGLGLINIFNTDGILQRRFATGGSLNAPWGIMLAPPGSGFPNGTILVGNFGDGSISIFDSEGLFLGKLSDCNAIPQVIDGLWGLVNGPPLSNKIYFASGPNKQADGVMGELTKC